MSVSDFFDAMKDIKTECLEIREQANALATIGCDRGANVLFEAADVIDDKVVSIRNMYVADLDKRSQEAARGTGMILNALVAGSRIGNAVEVLPHTLGAKEGGSE